MLTQEKMNLLRPIEDHGKFIHTVTEKLYVSATEKLLKIELEYKQSLVDIPKEVKIECYELLENGEVDTNKISIPLSDLKMIASIKSKDSHEIFYVEN